MAKKINILFEDDAGNGIYGAKVYIGTKSGGKLYEANKGAITYIDGTATLDVGNLMTTQYVWLKDPNSNYESKQLYRPSKTSAYKFVAPTKIQEVQETTVIAKSSTSEADCTAQGGIFTPAVRNADNSVTPSKCTLPKKKWKTIHFVLIGIGILALVGGAIYYDQKIKK
jgi:hypothetical protein